jgi:hypothetical protein
MKRTDVRSARTLTVERRIQEMEVAFQVDLGAVEMAVLQRSVRRLLVIQKMVTAPQPKVSMRQEIAIQIVGAQAVLEGQLVVVPSCQMLLLLLLLVGTTVRPCLDRLLRLTLTLMRLEGVSAVTTVILRQQGL